MEEEKNETIRIGLWTYTVLIVALIILTSAVIFGWYYIFVVKKADNSIENTANQITNKIVNQVENKVENTTQNGYVYNKSTGYYQRNGKEYTYNEYTGEMQLVSLNNYEDNYDDYIYYDPNAATVVTLKVSPEFSASTILKTLYEDAYFVYTSQVGFEYKQGEIQNYNEVINKYLNSKAKEQYEKWTNQNGRWQSSEIINVRFKDIKVEDSKIEATVVGDLIYGEEVLKQGLESKFSIEHNGKNWVINEYAIPDTFVRDYVQYSEQYRITKLNEITEKIDVKDLLPDYLQTQDYEQDRYRKIDYEINTYENNSIRIIDLYHKNNYNWLEYAFLKIKLSDDKKSATVDMGDGQDISIQNINGTIKKIFVGEIYENYMPVMLMENGTVKIATLEYGKYYAKTVQGLEDIDDLRNVTISSFEKNSNGDYELSKNTITETMTTCLIAIKSDGTAYKITMDGGY